MRRLFLLAGMLAACSGGLEEAEPTPGFRIPAEGETVIVDGIEYVAMPTLMGSSETEPESQEAPPLPASVDKRTYVIPNGYGQAVTGPRCNNYRFPGGICRVPKYKAACVRNKFFGVSADTALYEETRSAEDEWVQEMAWLGWSTAVDDIACAFTIGQVMVGYADLPSGVAGAMTPLVRSGDPFEVSAGTVQPWTHAEIRIDPEEIENSPGYDDITPEQKRRYARNIVMHELFHAAGLGHNSINFTLMYPDASSDSHLRDMSALLAEKTLIYRYDVD